MTPTEQLVRALRAAHRYVARINSVLMTAENDNLEEVNLLHKMEAALAAAEQVAAPSSAPAVSEGWQPIETAPKNGTAILLLYKGHALEAAWKCVDSGDWETSQGPTYYWDSIFDCFDDGTEPTHWMPYTPLAASQEYKP